MKKTLLTFVLFVGLLFGAKSQNRSVKLGIKIAPTVSYARVIDKKGDDNVDYSRGGSVLRLIIGPYVDFGINDNVTFSTGLWYSPRSIILQAKANNVTAKSQYNLQYVMVPLYFKFYTNEITSGLKLYFTLGGTIDVKVAEKKIGNDDIGLKELAQENNKPLFNYVDASILLGAGVEYNLKDVTTLYAGFSYNRGLINAINPLFEYTDANGHKIKPYQNLAIKNNLISLDLGVKF